MASKKSLGRPRADAARDLRSELLQTSRQLLDEGGSGALSLREVARRSGCTHQAPYHYFADRETLLAHQDRWVTEPQPTQRDLPRLTEEEHRLYDDLRWRRLREEPLRLEQERIAFGRVEQMAALR